MMTNNSKNNNDDVAVAAESSQQTNTTQKMTSSLHNSSSSKTPARSVGDMCLLFPFRLHKMLDAAEEEGFTSVVSWLPNEVSFKVHDKETFVSLIIGQYFEQHHYKSFQRQLNMWGFTRYSTKDSPELGGYTHQFLMRGKPFLCSRMNRSKKPKKTVTATSSVQKMKTSTAATLSPSLKGDQCKKNKKVSPPTTADTTTPSTSTVLEASLQTTTPLSGASSVVSLGDSETSSYQQDLDRIIGSCCHSDERQEESMMIVGQWEAASTPSSSFCRPEVIQFLQKAKQQQQQEGVYVGNNYYSPYASISLSATVEFAGRQFFPLVDLDNDEITDDIW